MCDPGLIRNTIFKTIVAKRLKIIMDQRSCLLLPNFKSVYKPTVWWSFILNEQNICRKSFRFPSCADSKRVACDHI